MNEPTITMPSTLKSEVRKGSLMLVIQISNMLVKRAEVGDTVVINYLEETLGSDWISFVQGELASCNQKNNRTLGLSGPKEEDQEDEIVNYDK